MHFLYSSLVLTATAFDFFFPKKEKHVINLYLLLFHCNSKFTCPYLYDIGLFIYDFLLFM